jgi:flagellar basal-body rod protein FlgC
MYNVIEVLASGLSATRLRVNVLASNIANAETTRTEDGGPYKRKDIVQTARTVQSNFSSTLDNASLAKPQVLAVVEDQSEPRVVHQPGHPDADENGYVAYPNINMVTAMTDLMSASRLYQANVSALETARNMARDAANISIRY